MTTTLLLPSHSAPTGQVAGTRRRGTEGIVVHEGRQRNQWKRVKEKEKKKKKKKKKKNVGSRRRGEAKLLC